MTMNATRLLLAVTLGVIGGVRAVAAQADSARSDSAGARDPRARFLIDRRCSDCHTVSVLKIKSTADVGPDLSSAYADVPFRYGMTLDRFFDQPAGIMRMVLGGRPALARAERDSLVTLFRDLYNEQLARLDSARRRPRPVKAS
jgi:hypothetical protein